MIRSGNIFGNLPMRLPREEATVVADRPGAVVERIARPGQASPPGFWFDQNWAEWVVVLAGAAGLQVEGEGGVEGSSSGAIMSSFRRMCVTGWSGRTPTDRLSGSRCTGGAGRHRAGRSAGLEFASGIDARSRCGGCWSEIAVNFAELPPSAAGLPRGRRARPNLVSQAPSAARRAVSKASVTESAR